MPKRKKPDTKPNTDNESNVHSLNNKNNNIKKYKNHRPILIIDPILEVVFSAMEGKQTSTVKLLIKNDTMIQDAIKQNEAIQKRIANYAMSRCSQPLMEAAIPYLSLTTLEYALGNLRKLDKKSKRNNQTRNWRTSCIEDLIKAINERTGNTVQNSMETTTSNEPYNEDNDNNQSKISADPVSRFLWTIENPTRTELNSLLQDENVIKKIKEDEACQSKLASFLCHRSFQLMKIITPHLSDRVIQDVLTSLNKLQSQPNNRSIRAKSVYTKYTQTRRNKIIELLKSEITKRSGNNNSDQINEVTSSKSPSNNNNNSNRETARDTDEENVTRDEQNLSDNEKGFSVQQTIEEDASVNNNKPIIDEGSKPVIAAPPPVSSFPFYTPAVFQAGVPLFHYSPDPELRQTAFSAPSHEDLDSTHGETSSESFNPDDYLNFGEDESSAPSSPSQVV